MSTVSESLTSATTGAPAPTVNMPTVIAPLPPAPPTDFPIGWMLEHAALPLRYRALAEVAQLGPELTAEASWMPYAHPPALILALAQGVDGSWGNSMLGVPKAHSEWPQGVGTIQAVRRLLEYGWSKESPPLQRARRLLFRLLAEDDDPAYLFEFAADATTEDRVHRGRQILREAAAATLAQAGYERDPRLRGAALRITQRIGEFVRSPDAHKPWIRVGNRQVLPADASPPSIYSLTMLAHMPLFCSEHGEVMDRLLEYVTQPMPRQESVQIVGDDLVEQPHLVLGDPLPHRNAADADVPTAVTWLELMARLNFMRRCDHWVKLYERFLDDRDRQGVWHPHKGDEPPHTENAFVWPAFPLGSRDRPNFHTADVTFRLGLIARLSGRTVELL